MLAELGVAVAVGMNATIFLPQKLPRYMCPPQLLVDVLHIGQGAGRTAAVLSRWKQQRLELLLVYLFGQRPGESSLLGALQVFGDGGMGEPTAAGDLAVGESNLMLEAQNFGRLAHG